MMGLASMLLRVLGLCVLGVVALQLYFLLRVASMAWIDPQSTAFQRSEAVRILREKGELPWRQQWVPYAQISPHLKRAVIAAEDAGFAEHSGVEWEAIEKAWERNQRAEQRVQARRTSGNARPPKVVGGSTITQQLAKNLFLSGERNLLRKGQEFLITLMLEALLSKERILEIYLNHVEWGEGVFGAEAAARHYFRIGATQLSPYQAARLAVMLPAPKRFERRPNSAYVSGRAQVVVSRMGAVELP
ncbi:monofunctional biosynthetic peptidoglycan transglycosylase [Caldimonas tepidiphila]|uniref:monofunctional biosynthetic peptidoglycan transglycosylase n=1 Tax=Caldimonas tepidiphila TaxID=2315841 RepID=UPI000E5BB9E7|nr:monofunctional biosynthetic peptidoglycan transglycosylase [Caldimonas tepidiphila]